MDWHLIIYEVIDLRSFSNMWFWIALAVLWSSASHWVLGVPFDMVQRARRHGGQAQTDLEAIVHINIRRMLLIVQVGGPWLVGFAFFVLSGLVILGWFYDWEFAQAVFLLLLPMSFLSWMNVAVARRIVDRDIQGTALHSQMIRHRFWVQAMGMVSIFVTALWGMYQNLLQTAI